MKKMILAGLCLALVMTVCGCEAPVSASPDPSPTQEQVATAAPTTVKPTPSATQSPVPTTPAPTPTPEPTPDPNAPVDPAQLTDNTGYIMQSFVWEDDAGDSSGWGHELTGLRAGKWLSKEGDTSLYIDYDSSPDGFYYEISHQGTAWTSWTEIPDTDEAYAFDFELGHTFTLVEPGILEMGVDGETVTLYLIRSKYKQND